MEGTRLRKLICRLSICLLLAALVLPANCMAASMHRQVENPDIIMEASVGYDDGMTYGKVMPFRVRIQNNGADMKGTVAVNVYNTKTAYNRYETEIQLAQGTTREIFIPIKVYNKQEVFTAELVQDGEVICAVNTSPLQIVNPSAVLIGVLSSEPQNLAYLNVSAETDELMRGEYMQTISLTEETFPETLEVLDAFGIIVVDGFDVSTLSDEQRTALQDWLEAGHILILGGGAWARQTWTPFSAYTGLEAGEMASHEDFTPDLAEYLGISAETLNQDILICEGTGGEALIKDEDTPVLWRSNVGKGVIYTAAFELGAKPISEWRIMNVFWQKLFLKDSAALYQNYFAESYENYSSLSFLPQSIPMENNSGMAAMIAVGAGVWIVAVIVACVLLKRLDKRQYLWVALPLISIVCTGILCVMAQNGEIRQPVALSITAIRQDEEGNLNYEGAVTVAVADKGEHLITSGEGTLTPYSDSYYEDYSDTEKESEPSTLRYRFVIGEQNGVGVDFPTAWNRQNLTIEDVVPSEGGIESAIWREEDGMHGYIVNRTGKKLSEGAILCSLGYGSVPALEPDEKFEFTLLNASFADPENPVYEDGCIYETLLNGYSDIYTISSEYLYKISHLSDAERISYGDPISMLKQRMIQVTTEQDYTRNRNNYNLVLFHYVAFCDELPKIPIAIDGETVERRSDWGIVSAVLKYSGVGNTGVVYHMPGMDAAVPCQIDDAGKPCMDSDSTGSAGSYYRLSENPAFAFDFSEMGSVDISRLIVYSETYYRYVRMYIYDGEEWIEQKLSEEIENPERFVNENGKMYVQFKADISADEYVSVSAPTLLLEGRVK